MITLNRLLQAVEIFYKRAMQLDSLSKKATDTNFAKKDKEDAAEKWLRQHSPGYKAEPVAEEQEEYEAPIESVSPTSNDSNDLYPEIISFAKQINNPEVAEQLNKIADLYQKAVQDKKGYSLVSSAIGNFMDTTLADNYSDYDYEEDVEPGSEDITPEQAAKLEGQNVETLLNRVYGDINNRFAKQRDIEKGFVEPSGTAAETEDPEEIDHIGARPGLGTAVDIAEIGGKKSKEDGKTSSMSVTSIRDPKDWVKSYKMDKIRAVEQLGNPELNDKIRSVLTDQIGILDQLIDNTTKESNMLADAGISWTVVPKTDTTPRKRVPSEPALRSQYELIKEEQKSLRSANNAIKTKLRTYSILDKNNKIIERINQSSSPKERFLLQQQKLLNDLIASKDVGKTDEINVRRKFIKYIEGGLAPEQYHFAPEQYLPRLNPEMIQRFQAEIAAAASKKISFEDWDAARIARDVKKRQGLFNQEGLTEEEKANKKRRPRGSALGWEGHLKNIKEGPDNTKKGVKKIEEDKLTIQEIRKLTQDLKSGENTVFKPFIDNIIAARASGNKIQENKAVDQLAAAIKKDVEIWKRIRDEAEKEDVVVSMKNYNTAFKEFKAKLDKIPTVKTDSDIVKPDLTKISPELKQQLLNEGITLLNREANRITRNGVYPLDEDNMTKLYEGLMGVIEILKGG